MHNFVPGGVFSLVNRGWSHMNFFLLWTDNRWTLLSHCAFTFLYFYSCDHPKKVFPIFKTTQKSISNFQNKTLEYICVTSWWSVTLNKHTLIDQWSSIEQFWSFSNPEIGKETLFFKYKIFTKKLEFLHSLYSFAIIWEYNKYLKSYFAFWRYCHFNVGEWSKLRNFLTMQTSTAVKIFANIVRVVLYYICKYCESCFVLVILHMHSLHCNLSCK